MRQLETHRACNLPRSTWIMKFTFFFPRYYLQSNSPKKNAIFQWKFFYDGLPVEDRIFQLCGLCNCLPHISWQSMYFIPRCGIVFLIYSTCHNSPQMIGGGKFLDCCMRWLGIQPGLRRLFIKLAKAIVWKVGHWLNELLVT